ncbi:MAG: LamG domain-containing protein [Planctomycetota bacterium]|jgi:hypothetical protein
MCKKFICLTSFVLVLALVGTSTAQDIDPGLVGWWTFDEGAGTVAKDYSGQNNDGTFFGEPTWGYDGDHRGVLVFDGDDDYVFIDGLFQVPIYTIALWFRVDNGTGQRDIFSAYAVGVDHGILLEMAGDGTLRYLHRYPLGTGGGTNIYTTTSYDDGAWYHAVMVKTVDTITLYINGEELETTADTSVYTPGDAFGVALGCLDDERGLARLFPGAMDDVRIYNYPMSQEEIQAIMVLEPWPYASGPTPADGAIHEDTWANLNWQAGKFAVSHDVYIGDNWNDVNDGAESVFQGNQTNTFIVAGFPGFAYPDGLIPGTRYYWRVDEIDETNPDSPWKGDIWSFLIPPKSAYSPDPADAAESVDPQTALTWAPGYGAKLHTVYFGDNFDDVNNASGGLTQAPLSYSPGPLEMAKTYYWRVDEFDAAATHKGNVWSFTTEGAVGSPDPAKGAVNVTQTPVLTWVPGVFADTHEIFFGTDADAVENADTSSPEYKGSGNLGSESFEPGQLEWNTTYYWRIDEANNANANSPWTGNVWSFTTADFLIIDDFESYNGINEGEEGSNRIYVAWVDGYDDPLNGSQVGHLDIPFYEETIVHSGNKSMPIYYDNAVGKSEATMTLTSNRDWTVNGVNTLTFWFRGGFANDGEPIYVVINGTAGVDNVNPEAAKNTVWTQWNIDLQVFADQGVNLTNVDTITIGFGDRSNQIAGGSGVVFIDDIRLYPLAP